jgi:2-methylisocitrate lyase-like PEP mutase family enzyme
MSDVQQAKGETFHSLHEGDPFAIPNPWDAGSAKMLDALGFKALATTSAGFAFTLGRADGDVSLDEVAAHVTAIDDATSLPVSVDLENGHGPSPEAAANAIRRVAEAGAVGGSIEDWDPDEERIYELEEAAERVAAAAEAARSLGFPFTLTGRAENFVRDNPDLDDTIARLQAYEAAGADVLYAPRLTALEDARAICEAISKPVNVLVWPGMDMHAVIDAGAQRISVGAQLYWVAIAAAADASERLHDGEVEAFAARPNVSEWLG